MMKFTHTHVHSQFSVRDGLLKLEEAFEQCKKTGEAFAITDHGNISGWPHYNKLAAKFEQKPIFGVEIYINRFRKELIKTVKETNLEKDKDAHKELAKKRDELKQLTHHLVFIARNQTGFYNIIQLMNDAYVNYFYARPLVDYAALEKLDMDDSGTPGLIVTTACFNSPVRYLLKQSEDAAIEWIMFMKSIIGEEYFFLEVQANGMEDQKPYNRQLIELAKKTNTKLIFGSDSHYLTLSDHEAHQDLLLLQNKNTRNDLGKKDFLVVFENKDGETKRKKVQPGKEFRKGHPIEELKPGTKIGKDTILSVEEVNRVWSYASKNAFLTEKEIVDLIKKEHDELIPELKNILNSNKSIYDMIEHITFDSSLKLPHIENASKIFVSKIKEALRKYGMTERKYVDRVKYEMSIIQRFGFETYFLILADVMEWARNNDIPRGAGRGSTCGSFIAYLLDIHTINPFDDRWDSDETGLPFERFLDIGKLYDKIIVENEHGKKLEFLETTKIKVQRNKDIIIIEAGQLEEHDIIIEE